jgi:hypothetical protein
MGIEDGKTPVDEGGRKVPPPSSHAVRSVNARIQAGPVWMEIVHSDQLPRVTSVASGWHRLLAWRRSVPTSRLIALGAVAAAVVTAISLASSPYHLPKLADSFAVPKIVTTIGGGNDSDSGGGGGGSGADPTSTSAPSSLQDTVPSAPSNHRKVTTTPRTTSPAAPISPSIVGVGSSTTPTPSNTGSSAPASPSPSPTDSTSAAPTSATTTDTPTTAAPSTTPPVDPSSVGP